MEPTTKNNKTIIVVVIAVIIIIAIISTILITRQKKQEKLTEQAKKETIAINPIPTTVTTPGELDEINKYINEATTFDNEASLKEVEKEF